MNDNQFDNLTREFGKGISRRDMLKMIGSGLVALFMGRTEIRSAAALPLICPPKEEWPTSNDVVGTCTDLQDRLALGVQNVDGICFSGKNCQDRNGNPVPCCKDDFGLPIPCVGVTHVQFKPSEYIPSYSPMKRKNNEWCKTATVTKKPDDKNCQGTDQFFCFDWEVSKITWTPNYPICDPCRAYIDAWQRSIDIHEEQHVVDAETVVDAANVNWKPQYKACSDYEDPQTAEFAIDAQLKSKILADINGRVAKIAVAWDVLRDKFDSNSATQPLPSPDCELCKPCNTCAITCPDCEICNPDTNACEPVDCGSPCLECRNNSCQPKSCPTCTECNPQTGACDPVIGMLSASTQDICNDSCQGITCDECMHCENGLCVRTCTDTEICCGNQCINPSQYTCCITRDNGTFPCEPGWHCCAGGECCPPNEQCCGGQCVAYDSNHCANCFPCPSGQVCCIGDEGQIYGCDTAGNCPR